MTRYWLMMIADAILTVFSIVLGLMLRLEVINPANAHFRHVLETIWPFICLAAVLRPAGFYFVKIYHRMWRYATTRDFADLALAVSAGTVILAVVTLPVLNPYFMDGRFPRSLIILEGLISFILLGGFRIVIKFSERYDDDINWEKTGIVPVNRTLIVGAGDTGVTVARELLTNPQLGMRPVCFLDDDERKIGKTLQGMTVYGPLISIADVVRKQEIDEVVLAIPSAPEQIVKNIQNICNNIPVPVTTVPFISSMMDRMDGGDDFSASSLKIPMALPDITSEEIQAVLKVMRSRNLSIGSQTVEFERLIAEQAGTSFAAAVTNGTNALHLCIVAAGIGEGDEVITSPFSFIASANCILYEKAVPVFADIDPVTLNIDPGKIEEKITERTKAIIAVHIFGQPADMDPIMEIAKRHNLVVIEDACEAIGAEYKGRRAGGIGKAGTFAFYPNKQMTTGEGAALVTNDEEWVYLFRSLRNQGRDKFDGWLNHSRLGYNYRMSELNAAVGVVQLKRLDEILYKRNQVAETYNKALESFKDVQPLTIAPTTTRMSWFVYVVRFSKGIDRNEVIERMAKHGVPARPYFMPIHLQPFYRGRFGFKEGDFPESEAAGESIIALPFHTNMKKEEIEVVCSTLNDVLKEIKRES